MSRYFAVLDVKNPGIAAVAARWSKKGDYILEGFCRMNSKGFGNGTVADTALATDSVISVLDKLKKRTGKKIQNIYVGVSSTSINVISSSGAILLSKYGREICRKDIKRCIEIGSTVKVSLDKELLHRIVCAFSIDGDRQIKNPLKMEGVKLGVDVSVLTINSSVLNNMSKCIQQAGLVPQGFVFSGLASSYRVLSDEDLQRGVVLLDMHKDLTEVMLFHRGALINCKVLPVGIDNIMKDNNGRIDIDKLKKMSQKIASLTGWKKVARCAIIGEGIFIDNLIESLEKIFMFPVRPGRCITRPFENLPPEKAEYIGSLGILDYLQQEKAKQHLPGNIAGRVLSRALNFIDTYF